MWLGGTIAIGTETYYYRAKVYFVQSSYGINSGRVSKLAICKGDKWNHKAVIYNYDRGDDVDICQPEVLTEVLRICEALPRS